MWRRLRLVVPMVVAVCFTLFAEAGAIPTAIAGEAQTAALVYALLAPDESFELLDRDTVEALQKEQLLSEQLQSYFPHAGLFVQITSALRKDGNVGPSRLIVFNAHNGYRLLHAPLPEDPAAAAQRVVELLPTARDKAVRPDAILLSVGEIRLLHLPASLTAEAAATVSLLSEQLNQAPEVQMLERDYLVRVLDEREFSSSAFTLAASCRVLKLEFSAGSEADRMNLRLMIADGAGSVLREYNYMDLTGDDRVAAAHDVLRFLEATIPEEADTAMEAECFWDEFVWRARNTSFSGNWIPEGWEEVGRTLAAAAALAPDNPLYQREWIFYRAMPVMARDLTWPERFRRLRRFKTEMEQWYERFQPGPDTPAALRFAANSHYLRNSPFSNYHLTLHPATDAERRELATVLAELNELRQWENRYWKRSLPGPVLQQKDMSQGILFFDTGAAADNLDAMQTGYRQTLDYLAWAVSNLERNPKLSLRYYRPRCFPDFLNRNDPFRYRETVDYLRLRLADLSEIEAWVTRVDCPELTSYLWELEAIRELLDSPMTDADMIRIGAGLLRKLHTELDIEVSEHEHRDYCLRYYDICGYLGLMKEHSSSSIFENALRLARRNPDQPEENALDFLRQWQETRYSGESLEPNFRRIPEFAAQLAELKPFTLSSGPWLAYQAFATNLYSWSSPGVIEAIRSISPEFEIHRIEYPKRLQSCNPGAGGGRIYFVYAAASNGDGTSPVFVFNPDEETFSDLPPMPLHLESVQVFWQVDRLLAGNGWGIGMYSFADGMWECVRDLSGGKLMGAAFSNGRIYYLNSSEATYSGVTALHSVRTDGSDRRLHFSSDRREKRNELDGIGNGYVSDLIALPGGDLFFWAGAEQGGGRFCRFSPADEQIRVISRTNIGSWRIRLQQLDDGRILAGAGQFGNFDCYDPGDDGFSPLMLWSEPQNNADHSGYPYYVPVIANDTWPLLITKSNRLFAPAKQLYYNLARPEATRTLFLPKGFAAIEASDAATVYWAAANGIYSFRESSRNGSASAMQ